MESYPSLYCCEAGLSFLRTYIFLSFSLVVFAHNISPPSSSGLSYPLSLYFHASLAFEIQFKSYLLLGMRMGEFYHLLLLVQLSRHLPSTVTPPGTNFTVRMIHAAVFICFYYFQTDAFKTGGAHLGWACSPPKGCIIA